MLPAALQPGPSEQVRGQAFNPIENAFSKLKALLRARGERTVEALWSAVGEVIEKFTPTECENYFAACGYDPT
jgi:transposase